MDSDLTPADFKKLEDLFRHAESLDVEHRLQFLEDIRRENTTLADELAGILETSTEHSDFLESSPALGGGPIEAMVAQVKPGDRIGPYTIEEPIGDGGMASVWRAVQERPRQDVALKVMRPGIASRDAMRRFELEAEILGTLKHPGIAHIHGAGVHAHESGAVPWLAMELIDGVNIVRYAEREELGIEGRVELVREMCDAVQHAHHKGIIHRDLKPSNVLVDSFGRARVLDFGIARAAGADVRAATAETSHGQILGTIAYMSPEQTTGNPHDVDTRSDVYALGLMLYELLAGDLHYTVHGRTIHEVLETIRQVEPRPLGQLADACRGDLETIAGKALAKEKDRRYPGAAELAADLQRWQNDEPVLARRPGAGYRLGKLIRRHAIAAAGIFAVTLALTAGLIVALVLLAAKERALDEAEASATQYKTMFELFKSTLDAAHPVTAERRYMTLRDFVDAMARQLYDRFGDTPGIVPATLHNVLGETFGNLGIPDVSRQHLETSYEMWNALVGDDDPRTADVRLDLAISHGLGHDPASGDAHLAAAKRTYERNEVSPLRWEMWHQTACKIALHRDRYADALQHVEAALAASDRYGGSERGRSELRRTKARILFELGRGDEAWKLASEVLAWTEENVGRDHAAVIPVLRDLVRFALERGDGVTASKHVDRAIRILHEVVGEDSATAHEMEVMRGSVLLLQARFEDAEEDMSDLIERLRRAGREGMVLARARWFLINALDSLKRTAEAEEPCRELVESMRDAGLDESGLMVRALIKLTQSHIARRDFAEAERLLMEAVAIHDALPAAARESHPRLTLGGMLFSQRRFEEAAEVQRRLIADLVAQDGDRMSAEQVTARGNLGMCLFELQQYEAAERELATMDHLEDSPLIRARTAYKRSLRGLCLSELDRFEDAEKQLLRAWNDAATAWGVSSPQTATITDRIKGFYHSWDEPEKLAAFKRLINKRTREVPQQ